MKRYRFRLETVLRVRRIQEDQARQKVAVAAAAATLAEQRATEIAESYRALPGVQVRGPVGQLMAARFEPQWRAAGVSRSRVLAAQAEQVRVEQVDHWLGVRRSVEVLERLDERRRAEHAVEVRRDEDAAVDDLVAGRYEPPARPEPHESQEVEA